jgi:hypothetical protein
MAPQPADGRSRGEQRLAEESFTTSCRGGSRSRGGAQRARYGVTSTEGPASVATKIVCGSPGSAYTSYP